MNINNFNGVQNFFVSKSLETDNKSKNQNLINNQTAEIIQMPSKQMVDAQTALANYKVTNPNVSFKGTWVFMTDEELKKKQSEFAHKYYSLPEDCTLKNSLGKYCFSPYQLHKYNVDFALNVISNPKMVNNAAVCNMIKEINDGDKLEVANKIISDDRLLDNYQFMTGRNNWWDIGAQRVIECTNWETIKEIKELIFNEDNLNNQKLMSNASCIIPLIKMKHEYKTNDYQQKFIKELLADKNAKESGYFMEGAKYITDLIKTPKQLEFAKKVMTTDYLHNPFFMGSGSVIIHNVDDPKCSEIIEHITNDEEICNNKYFMDGIQPIACFPHGDLKETLKIIDDKELTALQKLILLDTHPVGSMYISDNDWIILKSMGISGFKNYNKAIGMENARKQDVKDLLLPIKYADLFKMEDFQKLTQSQKSVVMGKFPPDGKLNAEIKALISDFLKFNKIIGLENAEKLTDNDTQTAATFIDLYKKQNINEIPRESKKKLLKELVASQEGLFNISDEMKQMFPIIPTNKEDYCKLLPEVIRSLGIDTGLLTRKNFNENLNNIASTLENTSGKAFKYLKITQEYSKDEFIKDTLDKIKNLPEEEKQKVFDYFGFELYEHEVEKKDKTKITICSISGYPVNQNNGKKLSQIDNPQTRAVIEDLRAYVIKFTKNNKIICSHKQLEQQLNELIKALPELRPSIGCFQAGMYGTEGSHQFDVFTHSLKVMQGIVRDPKYKELKDPSDKKIMLLAALLHDITKEEGATDRKHAGNSSFDASLIIKKLKLTKEEEIKLYTLIKSHEWLGYVNSATTEKERIKRQQSVAYDLRHDNLFDMALIFAHADLKGVNDEFHDIKNEKRISKVDGITRSYGEAAEFHAEKIRQYIEQLKPSQPLLPVTKIPSADTISQSITEVHPDGSTNIKGVYKDKDGLIVIKYNELENENLEKIGFPKGSITSGIKATGVASKYDEKFHSWNDVFTDVNTGNIKFFAHGLEAPNQLTKFDAFSLINSDVLLSASYAERPESKYRFFRPQGILLDCDTKYVHGGGETDAGSGTGKFINKFKENYIFGGYREGDRKFISNLIKTTLKDDIKTDEDYIKFVDEHKNDSLLKIDEEKRNELIKAYAGIKSKIRKGKREYNEMYISNPKSPMAVFAYAENYNEKISNPIEFLHRKEKCAYETKPVNERTEFLRQYALEKNLPFIIFGD